MEFSARMELFSGNSERVGCILRRRNFPMEEFPVTRGNFQNDGKLN